jgi:hypothetical protein
MPMAERRYTDEETAAIFKAAAELQQATPISPGSGATSANAGDGMTLAQLQDGLERRGRASVRRFLGLPIGVGRTVALDRTLTDAEWERLVVDLRQTFDARGRLRTDGAFRQWTNGNLQALLEPTPTGQQLRLRSMKGDAYTWIRGGFAILAFDAFLVALRAMNGRVDGGGIVFMLGAFGAAMIGMGALRIPAWAKERQRQMEDIVARLTETTTG